MSLRFYSLAATATLLAACAAPQPQPPPRPPPIDVRPVVPPRGGNCDAGPAQGLVGQGATARNLETARVRSGAHMARTIRPGQMVTKEFDPERLNVELDAGGRILALRCG